MNIHPQNRIAWACLVCGNHGDRDVRDELCLKCSAWLQIQSHLSAIKKLLDQWKGYD